MSDELISFLWGLLKSALAWLVLLMSPSIGMIGVVLFTVLVDYITSKLAKKGKDTLRQVWIRGLLIFIALFTTYVVQSQFMPSIPLTKIMAGGVAIRQLGKIYSNIKEAIGMDLSRYVDEHINKFKK